MDQWRAGGGRLNRKLRRRIPPPAEVLPRWHRGIEAAARNPVSRDAVRMGLYTGMRRDEVLDLRWERLDMAAMVLTIEETRSGEPLEFPITRQIAAILEGRLAARDRFPERSRAWVFPSEISRSKRIGSAQHRNARIGGDGGAKFGFHALRNCFITVADRERCCRAARPSGWSTMRGPRT